MITIRNNKEKTIDGNQLKEKAAAMGGGVGSR